MLCRLACLSLYLVSGPVSSTARQCQQIAQVPCQRLVIVLDNGAWRFRFKNK